MISSTQAFGVKEESKSEEMSMQAYAETISSAQDLTPQEQVDVDEHLYLLGRPTLKQFLQYARGHALNPPDEGALIQQWQAAHTVIQRLRREEQGSADNPTINKIELNSTYEPLLTEFLKDPLVQNGFNAVPTEVAFVELDRLVVYQKHIDLTFVRQLEKRLGPKPSEDQIFKTCLPYDHPKPPVQWSRVHGRKFVFVSQSNDLRFLGTMQMSAGHIKDYPPPGNIAGVVGLAVGFGSNFLNAIRSDDRLILNNGSHRAYTLRKLGITHVPCVIQHASMRDELDEIAASEVAKRPDDFLKDPRPPMLKDYFDARLHTVMQVRRRLHQVTVSFSVDENFVPAI